MSTSTNTLHHQQSKEGTETQQRHNVSTPQEQSLKDNDHHHQQQQQHKRANKQAMMKNKKKKKPSRISITLPQPTVVLIQPSTVFTKYVKKEVIERQAVPQQQPTQEQYRKAYDKQDVLKSMSVGLVLKYKMCSSDFKYSNPRRVITNPSTPVGNNGLDNADGNLILYVDDVLDGRFCVKDILGQGTFGQVARCEDIQNQGRQVAVKVIKNKRAYLKQAEVETRILEHLCKQCDPDGSHHIIRLIEHFTHQGHLCIVFELLSINLFELIKQNRFRGLSTNVISVFLSQVRSIYYLCCTCGCLTLLISDIGCTHSPT